MEFHYTYDPKTLQPSQRPVVNLNTGDVYSSISAVSRAFGVNYGPTVAIARNKRYKGYYWQYKDVVDASSIEEQLAIIEKKAHDKKQSRWKPVVNLNTGETFENVKAAEKKYCGDDKPYSCIGQAIKKRTICLGYYWQYEDIVEDSSLEEQLAIYTQSKKDNKRSVVNLNTGQVFESLIAVRKFYNTRGSVADAIKFGNKYQHYYWQYKDVVDQSSIEEELTKLVNAAAERVVAKNNKLRQKNKKVKRVRHYVRNELGPRWRNIEGSKFGKLTCVEFDECRSKQKQKYIFKCICECGNVTYIDYRLFARPSGKIKSCGCAVQDAAISKILANDISGKRFGNLTTLSVDLDHELNKSKGKYKGSAYKCICDCGNEITVLRQKLIKYETDVSKGKNVIPLSCGCLMYDDNIQNRYNDIRRKQARQRTKTLVGQTFGELTVVSFNKEATDERTATKKYATMWNCICSCGKQYIAPRSSLLTGGVQSCGHLLSNSSSWERRICRTIHDLFPNLQMNYHGHNKQIRLHYTNDDGSKGYYMYDCTINNKFIIECNGTTYHPKSRDQTFKDGTPWTTPFKKTNHQVYDHDRKKLNFAHSKGYKTLVVWDDQNFDEIIKQIINWLQSEGAFV